MFSNRDTNSTTLETLIHTRDRTYDLRTVTPKPHVCSFHISEIRNTKLSAEPVHEFSLMGDGTEKFNIVSALTDPEICQ